MIIILGVLVVALIGWWTLSGGSTGSTAPTLSTSNAAGVSSPADQTLVTTLLALRAVQLDGTIFSDPAFMSLKDFSTPIVPEPIGRSNPFAPLSSGSGNTTAASSTRAAVQLFTPHR